MNVLCLDFETTGKDPDTCYPTELGAVLWNIERKRVLHVYNTLIKPVENSEKLSIEASIITNIKNEDINEYGIALDTAFIYLHSMILNGNASFIVAHNGNNFDRKIFIRMIDYLNEIGLSLDIYHLLKKVLWIDTMTDLPLKDFCPKNLLGMCAFHQYYIQDAHSAYADALGCAHMISQYPIEKTIERAKSPYIEFQAMIGEPWGKNKVYHDKMKPIAYDFGFRYDMARNHGRFLTLPKIDADKIEAEFPFQYSKKEVETENTKIMKGE